MITDRVNAIVEKLGGAEQAARLCGTTLSAVFKWRVNGIPHKHWDLIAAKARVRRDTLRKTRPGNGDATT